MFKNFIPIYEHKKFDITFNDFRKNIFVCDNGEGEIKSITELENPANFIRGIIKMLLKEKKTDNVLTTGYVLRDGQLDVKFFYSGHKYIFKREFFEILEILKREKASYLLTNCSIIYKCGDKYEFLAGNPNDHISYRETDKIDKKFLFKVVNFRKISTAVFDDYDFLPAERKKINNFIYRTNKINIKKSANVYFKEVHVPINRPVCDYEEDKNLTMPVVENKSYTLSQAITQYNKINVINESEEKYSFPYDKNSNCQVNHHYVKPKQVINFLFMISKKSMGHLFSEEDFLTLKNKIALSIYKPRNEKLLIGELLRNFKIKNIKFLHKKNNIANHRRRKKIMTDLLQFIFTEIYIPIISTCFYSTETSEHKSNIVYILKQNWYKNLKIADEKLKANLREVSVLPENVSYATTRFLPKGNDHRQIINMKNAVLCRGSNNFSYYRSYNSSTKIPFSVFNFELSKIKSDEKFTFDFRNIYELLHRVDLKNKYILKFDVVKCYDNIDIMKLKNVILNQSQSHYIVQKGYSYNIKNDLIFKTFTNEIVSSNLQTRNSNVTVPTGIKIYTKEEIFADVERNIRNIKIKLNNRYYEKTKGIPQGSNIGHFLCTYFFIYLNKSYLDEIFENAYVLRFVDDFLIITDNLEVFRKFLEKSPALREEGMEINSSKIEANFNFTALNSEEKPEIEKEQFVSWCGLQFNTRGIKLNNRPQVDSLSHINNNRKGEQILLKSVYYLERDVKPILFIRNHYKNQNVYDISRNIFSNLKRLIKRLDFFNEKFILQSFPYLFENLIKIFKKRNIYFNEDLLKGIYLSASEQSQIGKFLMGKFFNCEFENMIIEKINSYVQKHCNITRW